mgnify:FL=1|tara:strand:+ start:5011 stop:5481 length:471 start_codon:yes stop_codon:yes gene_type:complete
MQLEDIKQLDVNRQWAIYWYLHGKRSPVFLFGLPLLAAVCALLAIMVWQQAPSLSTWFFSLLSFQPSAMQDAPSTALIALIVLVALAFYLANSAELAWRKERDAKNTLKERTGLNPSNLNLSSLKGFQPDLIDGLETRASPSPTPSTKRERIAGQL